MRLIATLFLFISFFTSNAQQDLELIYIAPWTWPSNNIGTTVGCSDDSNTVKIGIKNSSGSPTSFGVYFYVGYLLDGVHEQYDSVPTLGGFATWLFAFDTTTFSLCNHTYEVKTYVSYANDPNHNNDTMVLYYTNYCSFDSISGSLLNDTILSDANDLDTLEIQGYGNATDYLWEYSTDTLNWNNVTGNNNTLPISYQDSIGYYRVIVSNPGCGTDTSNIARIVYNANNLSLSDLDHEQIAHIYPNPSSSYITVSQSKGMELLIYDAKGVLVLKQYLKDQDVKIDITKLTKGTYMLTLIGDQTILHRKLVVE
ncbi:MAG: T9SS type A sorting domain-containing protein [Crocinitomicaceae bacterium]